MTRRTRLVVAGCSRWRSPPPLPKNQDDPFFCPVLLWLLSFVASFQLTTYVDRWGFAAISRHGTVWIRVTKEIESPYPEVQAHPLANYTENLPLTRQWIICQLLPFTKIEQTPNYQQSVRFRSAPQPAWPLRRHKSYEVSIPWWIIFAVILFWPPRLLRHRENVRQGDVGHCAICGYDLRASTGRCPECGTAIPSTDRGGVESDPPGKLL